MMKNTQLLGCALVPLITQTTCVMASDKIDDVERLSLDAEKLFMGTQKSDLIEITWAVSDEGVCLNKLTVKEPENGKAEIALTIPGQINGQIVAIAPKAFKSIDDTISRYSKVKTHLIFKEVNGKKVMFPKSCKEMFANSNTICGIDFSGVDASLTTGMQGMFSNCLSLTEIDISPLSLSRMGSYGTDHMFEGIPNLNKINIASLSNAIPKTDPDIIIYKMLEKRETSESGLAKVRQYSDIERLFKWKCRSLHLEIIPTRLNKKDRQQTLTNNNSQKLQKRHSTIGSIFKKISKGIKRLLHI